MALEVTVAPAVEPVTLTEAKDFLRVTGSDDETLITELIVAARRAGEDFTRRTFVTTTYKLSLDGWPMASNLDGGLWEGTREGAFIETPKGFLELPKPPLISITSVTTYDDADNATVWDAANYYVDSSSAPGRVVPRSGQTFPSATRVANGIEIVFKGGYGDAATDVPRELIQGMLMLIAHLHEQREPVVVGTIAQSVPGGVEKKWRPFRMLRT